MQQKIRKNPLLFGVVVTAAILLILVNLLPLIYKRSNAAASFLANWNSGLLNAFVGNGDITATTDTVLPDLVDGGFGGTGQAMQASRGDTLKYATANNLDNNKVEFSMELKNKYALTGVDQGKNKFFRNGNITGIDYDESNQVFYMVENISNRIIKTNWSGTIWETLEGFVTNPRRLIYDETSQYLFISDGNTIVRTKFDGSSYARLGGFNSPNGMDYDSATEYIYVANTGSNNIIKTKIDGSGWVSYGSGGAGVNQFNYLLDLDYDAGSEFVYVADYNNNRIVKTKIDGAGWTTLGLTNPLGVQYVSSSDMVYVAYTSTGSQFARTKMDGSGQLLGSVNSEYRQNDFVFSETENCYFLPDYYVTQFYLSNRKSLIRINVDGSGFAQSVHNSHGDSNVYSPKGVWYENGNLSVLTNGPDLLRVSADGSDYKHIGGYGVGPGLLGMGSWYIWIDTRTDFSYDNQTGNYYVADGTTGYDQGCGITRLKIDGSNYGRIAIPDHASSGVAFEQDTGNVYSGDHYFNQGLRKSSFSGDPTSLISIPGAHISGLWYDQASDYIYLSDSGKNKIYRTKYDGTDFTELAGFSHPEGLYYDSSSEFIFVSDTGTNSIIKTKMDGSGWMNLGGFNAPEDVFYDSASDYIYVADRANNRIVKTQMDGTGWTNMTLDPRRVLFKTQGDEMRLELDLYSQRLKFWMKKATGGIFLQSEPLNWGIDEWHKPSVYFNRATGKVELKIDDVVVDSADDMTWTTALPSFGSYIYVSTDPANPDAVNVSPIDDFKVNVETVDTIDPVNPVAVHGYDSSQKAVEFLPDTWGNGANPHFEFSGATDDLSGLLGYWVYFGPAASGDPITEGVYQAHAGPADAVQNYNSSATLVSGTTYYLRVRTRDNDYNYSEPSTLFAYKYDGGPPSPPEYINSSPQGCSTSSTFTYTWPKVPEEVSGLAGYEYRKGSTGTIQMVPGLNLNDETYSFATTPYQEGDNVFYLRAKDNAGNVSNWQTAVTCSTGITYIIDGPAITTGPSSMTVNWTSSKKTTGFIEVRDANSYREPQGHRNFEMAHKITVTGLKSEREYEYRIVWEDESKNDGETGWFKTTTQALPRITDLKAEVISPTRAIVSWNTNYPSSATLEWGVTSSGQKVILPGSATNFSYQLDNLVGNTTYLISANCTTLDGADYTAGSTFQTPPLPLISGIRFDPVTDQSSAGMRITWVTNVETTSTVFFGPEGETKLELSTSERVKEHQIAIPNLQDNTDYEMYASGTDSWGNIATSEINSFKTALDTRPAKISAITIESSNVGLDKQDKAQIAVSWKSDEATTSMVEFGEGISGVDYSNKTTEDAAFTTNHLVIIPDLSPSRPYHLRVIATDKGGNISKSEDHTVIPGDVPRSALQIILQTFTRLFGWLGL